MMWARVAAVVALALAVRTQGTGEELRWAAEGGDLARVQQLVEAGVSVDDPGEHMVTPLMLATNANHSDVAAFLLSAGADAGKIPSSLKTNVTVPLITAVKHGLNDLVPKLIQAGAGINLKYRMLSPLTQAVFRNNVDAAKALLDAGASPDTTSYVSTALMIAAEKNNFEIGKMLIEAGANLEARRYGVLDTMPLFKAVKNNATEMVQLLVQAGADVNHQAKDKTLLSIAKIPEIVEMINKGRAKDTRLVDNIANNRWDVVEKMLKEGVTPQTLNQRDEQGRTGLMITVMRNWTDRAQALLVAGAHPDLTDNNGKTALNYAMDVDGQMVGVLAAGGADLNFQNRKGDTALIGVTDSRKMWAIESLLKEGARIDIQSDQGYTACHVAARYPNREELLKRLLSLMPKYPIYDNSDFDVLLEAVNYNNTIGVIPIMESGKHGDFTTSYGRRAVRMATFDMNVDMLKLLVSKGPDLSVADDKELKSRTALMEAAKKNCVECARILLDSGANFNLKNEEGETALSIAKSWGYREIGQMLIDAGAIDDDAGNLLIAAVRRGDVAGVRQLLADGAKPEARDLDGRTPLMHAARDGNLDIMNIILGVNSEVEFIDNVDKDKHSALYFAINGNYTAAAKVLLAIPGITYNDFYYSIAPLTRAVQVKNMELVQELLAKQVLLHSVYRVQDTNPVIAAAENNLPDFIKVLAEAGLDLDETVIKHEYNALMTAASRNHLEAVVALLDAGANVNFVTDDFNGGMSALSVSSRQYYGDEVAMKLIQAGAEVNSPDKFGWTPLMHSASLHTDRLLTVLLKNGADVSPKNSYGETALKIAMDRNPQSFVVQALREAGAEEPETDNSWIGWIVGAAVAPLATAAIIWWQFYKK